MAKTVKLNSEMLKKFVLHEAKKLKGLVEPKDKAEESKIEIDDDTSKLNSVENKVDFMKALKIKEESLIKGLAKVRAEIKKLTETKKTKKIKK